MNEDFEYTSPEEEAILGLIRECADKLPKTNMWIAHPVNYPRATKAIDRILEVIHKESPDAEHKIVFDELIGTGMSLMVKDWVYTPKRVRMQPHTCHQQSASAYPTSHSRKWIYSLPGQDCS